MSYREDIRQAARSGEGFDKANAEEIGNLHGEDPKHVLRHIQAVRRELVGDLEGCSGCDYPGCEECCQHGERDHGICLDCGHEEDPGAAVDRAQEAGEDR